MSSLPACSGKTASTLQRDYAQSSRSLNIHPPLPYLSFCGANALGTLGRDPSVQKEAQAGAVAGVDSGDFIIS